ncbi:MAG: sulfotransferase [Chloroflexi bacterium]|nr:sulfotransferase [Chloroflexota bacterium]
MTAAPDGDREPKPEPKSKLKQRGAWPSGVGGLDPRPTPIRLTNLWRWAQLTWRAERRYYGRLERPVRLTSGRLARSILPSLDRPLFLIGAARSGTTFLGECVGQIPEISYHHEPPATKAAGRYVYDRLWGFRRSRWFYRTVYAWLIRAELDGGLRFSEKTPTNSLLLPFLDRTFPDAQFIHIVRDGRDVAVSHLQKPWLLASSKGSTLREPGGYLHGPYAPWWVEEGRELEFEQTSDVHRMIWAWRRYVEAARREGPPLGPQRYLEVRYEDLVADPRRHGELMLDFMGIDAAASRATFLEALSRADPSSVGAWRRELNGPELAVIEADSGALLRRLGYSG